MEYYQERDLEEIVKRTADIFEVEVIDNALWKLLYAVVGLRGLPIVYLNECVILPNHG